MGGVSSTNEWVSAADASTSRPAASGPTVGLKGED